MECRLDPPLYRQAFLITVPPVPSARAFLELVSELEARGETDAETDDTVHRFELRPNAAQT
jgi:hypothetical protein